MREAKISPEEYQQMLELNEQIEQLNHYKKLLSQQLSEIEQSISSLSEINNTSENSSILAPVSNGIFINVSLKDNNKIMVNVGANTVVEKSIPEAIKLLEKEKKGVADKLKEAEEVLVPLNAHLMEAYHRGSE